MKAEIGRRLKKIRVERNLTQKELASRAGIDYTYIGKIERGEQLPSLNVLIKISETLMVPCVYFLEEKEIAALLELTVDLKPLLKKEDWILLLKSLKLIHEDDILLITEIIHVLNRHRKSSKNRRYESPEDVYLKAAEEEANYGKRKT